MKNGPRSLEGGSTLSDREIRGLLVPTQDEQHLQISRDNVPIDPASVCGASVDLHLANEFRILRRRRFLAAPRPLDLGVEDSKTIDRWYGREIARPERGFLLKSGEVALAKTQEFLYMPTDLCALVTGRSSYARLGLEVQCTQDLLGPGRHRTVPLQLINNAPFAIRLYPGVRICQVAFFRLNQAVDSVYGKHAEDKYQNETDLRSSRFFLDPEVGEIRKARKRVSDAVAIGTSEALIAVGGSAVGTALYFAASGAANAWALVVGILGTVAVAGGIAFLGRHS